MYIQNILYSIQWQSLSENYFTPRPLPIPPPILPVLPTPLGRPLPRVGPVPEPDAPLPDDDAGGGTLLPETAELPPTTFPLTLPRDEPPRPDVAAALLSAASLAAATAAFSLSLAAALLRSSSFRRSFSRVCASASASMSFRSLVAPCQWPERRRRWVCSVCERMRTQRFRRVFAELTVEETV